jgi:hypothetical protein
MALKETIKGWFTTGSKPTQEQFWAWMDSYWHKDENIPASKIEGLNNNTLELGETSTTAHRGDHGAAAYQHSQSTHVTSSDVATAKSEAISAAATDATSKANAAQSAAISAAATDATSKANAAQAAAQAYADTNKQPIVLSLPASGNAYVGVIVELVCGEAIVAGKLVTPATSGKAYKSNSTGVNMPATYIATENGAVNETKRFLKRGLVRDSSLTLAVGGLVYVDSTGVATTTIPVNGATIQPIGRALSATSFDFDPCLWTNDEKILNLYERSDPAPATGYVKVFNAIGSILKSINPSGIKHWLNAVLEHTPTRGDLLVYNGTTGYTSQPTEQDDTFVKASVMNISTDGLLTVMIPAGYEILSLYAEETNNTAAGNIALGSTALGTDVVASTAVGAMHDGKLTVAKPYFSKNNNTSLYISSSAWGLSSINLYFTFIKTR